jgi:hypothetical protein
MFDDYNIPSAVNKVDITETELAALLHPAKKPYPAIKIIHSKPGEILSQPPRFIGTNYYVSNFGVIAYRNDIGSFREVQGYKDRFGSKMIHVKINNRPHNCKVARLVLTTFAPDEHQNRMFVFYKDGNFENCHIDNLAWMSKLDLAAYKRKMGLTTVLRHKVPVVRGGITKYYKRSKYSSYHISEMERLIKAGVNPQHIAEIFKCSHRFVLVVRQKLKKKERLYGPSTPNTNT